MKKFLGIMFFLVMMNTIFAYNGLGNAYGRNEPVDRLDYIHYAKDDSFVRTEAKIKPSATTCYKTNLWIPIPMQYYINPSNLEGLDETSLVDIFEASALTWDDATNANLFLESLRTPLVPGTRDYYNVVAFKELSSGTIGVTTIWYYRYSKQIVEWDMAFNTYYDWGVGSSVDYMDFQNIATHELGHTLGLGDVYQGSCSTVTMYGYSNEGDIDKRTLELADITGLRKIYGI